MPVHSFTVTWARVPPLQIGTRLDRSENDVLRLRGEPTLDLLREGGRIPSATLVYNTRGQSYREVQTAELAKLEPRLAKTRQRLIAMA